MAADPKIAIITPGMMTSSYKTAAALAKRADVVVLIPRGKPYPGFGPGPRLKIYEMRNVHIRDPANFPIVPGIWLGALKVLFKERPEAWLVYKHMFFTSLAVPLLKLLGQRVITVTDTFPGMIWWTTSRVQNTLMWLYAHTLGRLVLRLSDRVVLLHEGLVPTARKLGLKWQVIHNGVDLTLHDKAKAPSDLKKSGRVVVTYVGRMSRVKGYHDLHAVALRLVKRFKNVEFWFVGGEARHSETERIRFLGSRDDVPGILELSDIYVLPSYSEGLPNTLMEAMAAKKAVVASGVGGVFQLVEDGKSGILVAPGDREQLEAAIAELVKNPDRRRKLGAAAYNKIERDFNWERLVEEYVRLLGESK